MRQLKEEDLQLKKSSSKKKVVKKKVTKKSSKSTTKKTRCNLINFEYSYVKDY